MWYSENRKRNRLLHDDEFKKISHLTPDQRSQIVAKFEKNATEEKSPNYQYIANWAAYKFKLNPVPNSSTIFRIIRNKYISKRRGKKWNQKNWKKHFIVGFEKCMRKE